MLTPLKHQNSIELLRPARRTRQLNPIGDGRTPRENRFAGAIANNAA